MGGQGVMSMIPMATGLCNCLYYLQAVIFIRLHFRLNYSCRQNNCFLPLYTYFLL